MNVFGTSDSPYNSRCGMSDVAIRTAPPIGGPSCLSSAIAITLMIMTRESSSPTIDNESFAVAMEYLNSLNIDD